MEAGSIGATRLGPAAHDAALPHHLRKFVAPSWPGMPRAQLPNSSSYSYFPRPLTRADGGCRGKFFLSKGQRHCFQHRQALHPWRPLSYLSKDDDLPDWLHDFSIGPGRL